MKVAHCTKQMQRDGNFPPPMDSDTYELILRWQLEALGDNMQGQLSEAPATPDRAGTQYTAAELKLREDFAKNKMRWVGEFWEDLWYFTMNTNPFVALCFSHPLHPVGRSERCIITLFQALFVMIVSCGLGEAQECLSCGIVSCDIRNDSCHQSYPEYQEHRFVRDRADQRGDELQSPPLNMCCSASIWGMIWVATHVTIGDYQIGVPMYALVANVVFGQVCFCLAMCCCCQAKPMRTRNRWERCGQAAVVLVGAILGLTMPWFLTYIAYNGMLREVLLTFITAKFGNAAGTTAFQILLFCIIWRRQKGAQTFHVSAENYQKYVNRSDTKGGALATLTSGRLHPDTSYGQDLELRLPTIFSGVPDPDTVYAGDREPELSLEPNAESEHEPTVHANDVSVVRLVPNAKNQECQDRHQKHGTTVGQELVREGSVQVATNHLNFDSVPNTARP